MPTIASGTSAMMALAASIAASVRSVTSSVRTPPATSALRQRHRVLDPLDGEHGDDDACLNSAASLSCFGKRSHGAALRGAGIASRGMMAPG